MGGGREHDAESLRNLLRAISEHGDDGIRAREAGEREGRVAAFLARRAAGPAGLRLGHLLAGGT